MKLTRGSEMERLMKAVIEKKILPSAVEILKKLRNPLTEKSVVSIEVSEAASATLSPLLMGDIYTSMAEIHTVAHEQGAIIIKYAFDHPDEFDFEKLIEETNDSMEKEGWL